MNQYFVEALNTEIHPIKKDKKKTRAEYITALTYIIEKTICEANIHHTEMKEYVAERLRLYQNQLFAGIYVGGINEVKGARCVSVFAKSWRSKYRYMLVCDVALILLDEELVFFATKIMKEHLSSNLEMYVVLEL